MTTGSRLYSEILAEVPFSDEHTAAVQRLIAHVNDQEARISLLSRAISEHHAVGVMDEALVGDHCPVCTRLQVFS